jgi:hypothetical protein
VDVPRAGQIRWPLHRAGGLRPSEWNSLDLLSQRHAGFGSAEHACACCRIRCRLGAIQPLRRFPVAVFRRNHVLSLAGTGFQLSAVATFRWEAQTLRQSAILRFAQGDGLVRPSGLESISASFCRSPHGAFRIVRLSPIVQPFLAVRKAQEPRRVLINPGRELPNGHFASGCLGSGGSPSLRLPAPAEQTHRIRPVPLPRLAITLTRKLDDQN